MLDNSFLISSTDFLNNVCLYLPIEDVNMKESEIPIANTSLSQYIDILPYNIALLTMLQFPEYSYGFRRFLKASCHKLGIDNDLMDLKTLAASPHNQLIIILAMQYYFV
jgi:hypothetical protein